MLAADSVNSMFKSGAKMRADEVEEEEPGHRLPATKIEHFVYLLHFILSFGLMWLVIWGPQVDRALPLMESIILVFLDFSTFVALSQTRVIPNSRGGEYRPVVMMPEWFDCTIGKRSEHLPESMLLLILLGEVALLVAFVVLIFNFRPDLLQDPGVSILFLEVVVLGMKLIFQRRAVCELLQTYHVVIPCLVAVNMCYVLCFAFWMAVCALPEQLYILFLVLRFAPRWPSCSSDTVGPVIDLVDTAI